MGLTIIDKILLNHSRSKKLEDFIYADVDFCFGNDITAPLAVKEFSRAGFDRVFNKNKIGFICDHFVPARDMKSANNVAVLRSFSQRFSLKHFYDADTCGVEHVFLPEKGLINPGGLIIGADSHTCTYGAVGAAGLGVGSTDLAAAMRDGACWFKRPETIRFFYTGTVSEWFCGKDLILYTIGKIGVAGALYKVMEFSGPVVKGLSMDERFTMCNMAVEAGAKTGIIEPDKKTLLFMKKVNPGFDPAFLIKSDHDAKYREVINIDVTGLRPQVACPHLPENVRPAHRLGKVRLDQVVVGSCTNGRISDLKIAAGIIAGKKVKKGLRALVIPATFSVYSEAEKKGYLKDFHEAGFIVCPPTCGPCLGGHSGILDKGETALATTNRNFIGRMGHPESFLYLSSPAVAAASSLTGRITDPCEVA